MKSFCKDTQNIAEVTVTFIWTDKSTILRQNWSNLPEGFHGEHERCSVVPIGVQPPFFECTLFVVIPTKMKMCPSVMCIELGRFFNSIALCFFIVNG